MAETKMLAKLEERTRVYFCSHCSGPEIKKEYKDMLNKGKLNVRKTHIAEAVFDVMGREYRTFIRVGKRESQDPNNRNNLLLNPSDLASLMCDFDIVSFTNPSKKLLGRRVLAYFDGKYAVGISALPNSQ